MAATQQRSLCDDCLSSVAEVASRQTVNQLARSLESVGQLRRGNGTCAACGKVKIVNASVHDAAAQSLSLTPPAASPTRNVMPPSLTAPRLEAAAAVLTEDELKRLLVAHLEKQGWKCAVAWAKTRGVDLSAERGAERWLIEAKGGGSLQPMRVNYFIGVLGETLQRMTDPAAKYSIAVPEHPQFRGLWKRLPDEAKRRTGITALFVAPNGSVEEVVT